MLTLLLGWPAVIAFGLYLAQGAMGAPFFAYGLGGMARLLGPTGGYLMGMLAASTYLAVTRNTFAHSRTILFIKLCVANGLMYSFGLMQLAWFVPSYRLLDLGFWPFLPGNFTKMFFVIVTSTFLLRKKLKKDVL